MMNINSLFSISNKTMKKTISFKSSKNLVQVNDVFEKSGAQEVVESARDFMERVLKPFADWKNPESFEENSALVSSLFKPYIDMIGNFKKKDAEHFTRLVFGEDTIEAIEIASKRNSDVKLFVNTLEEKLGSTIRNIITGK